MRLILLYLLTSRRHTARKASLVQCSVATIPQEGSAKWLPVSISEERPTAHLMSIQERLDHRRHQLRPLDVQHMSRACDLGKFNMRKYRAKCRRSAVGAELRENVRLLAHQHQQGRPQPTPARFRIFALVQYRIHPVVARIDGQADAAAGSEVTPG